MLRISLAGLLFCALVTGIFEARAGDVQPPATAAKAPALKLAPSEVAIYVSDMHCAGCAKKIAGKLYRVKGVVKVRTNLKQNLAVVTPQPKKQVDAKAAWVAVQKAGFKPTKMIGPEGTFVADEKTKEPLKVAEAESAKKS
jgi:copper chaperone CopZ